MGILIIGVGALLLGFVVILLLALSGRPEPAATDPGTGIAEAPHSWIARPDPEPLGKPPEMPVLEPKCEHQDTRRGP